MTHDLVFLELQRDTMARSGSRSEAQGVTTMYEESCHMHYRLQSYFASQLDVVW